MRKYLLLLSILLILSITGCGAQKVTSTYSLQIPMTTTRYVEMQIPSFLDIMHTDNNNYFEFDNEVSIAKAVNLPKGKKDGEVVYKSGSVARQFEDLVIVVNCQGKDTSTYVDLLNAAQYKERSYTYATDLELEALPEYTEQEMVMTEADLYMPVGATQLSKSIYTADVFYDNTDFVESYVLKDNRENMEQIVTNIALSNADRIYKWYDGDDIFYVESDKYATGFKRLAENKWCIYTATINHSDYARQGLMTVHFGE